MGNNEDFKNLAQEIKDKRMSNATQGTVSGQSSQIKANTVEGDFRSQADAKSASMTPTFSNDNFRKQADKSMRDKDLAAAVKRAAMPTQSMDSHEHKVDNNSKYRKEAVYTESGMGGDITEGCGTHYYERVVKLSVAEDEPIDYESIEQAIIIGDALAHPRFKHRY